MSFFGGASTSLTRRGLLKSAGAFTAMGVLVTPHMALAGGGTVDVTAAPYNASQGNADNSVAFQAALNAIAGNGGGRLYVPGGTYMLASPLSYTGGSLTVVGDGQTNTVLVNTHSGTVLSAKFTDNSKCLTVKDIGFSPCCSSGGGLAQGAIALTLPAQPSGWENALIEDVCIGVPYAGNGGMYSAYNVAISLTNTNRARMNNVNVHANGVPGGIAVALGGTCYDTRVLGCSLEGYSTGVSTLGYCEGIHLANNVIICNTAVKTGTANYGASGVAINLLELLMSDCEINTNSECLYLYQVKNAQIVNCHFTGPKVPTGTMVAAIDMRGCTESLVSNCTFDGAWAPGGVSTIGVAFNSSSLIPTTSCHVSDVQFENTTVGVYFGTSATSNTATNVQVMTPGCGGLVNGVGAYGQSDFVDVSGNSTNNASWLTTANTASAVTGRRVNSQH
jgi:hypothetical protein